VVSKESWKEDTVTDPAAAARVVAECERYWRETGVPSRAIAGMRSELEQHLSEAAADGIDADAVVGRDLRGFAEEWAAEHRRTPHRTPDHEAKAVGRRTLWTYAIGAAALTGGVVAGTLIAGGGDTVDDGLWRWVWVLFALGMGIGEIFTAGFFLLPFAIGAGVAAVLAWTGINLVAQWLVFFGVSLISFAYLRRFIDRQDALGQPRVGANRWVGTTGIVLEEIDPDAGTGMARVDNEQWRVTTDGAPIPAGTHVVVREVRGTRLVVETTDR
jgi:membrane protein implicated in regulation of membrane protease activity